MPALIMHIYSNGCQTPIGLSIMPILQSSQSAERCGMIWPRRHATLMMKQSECEPY